MAFFMLMNPNQDGMALRPLAACKEIFSWLNRLQPDERPNNPTTNMKISTPQFPRLISASAAILVLLNCAQAKI